MKKRILLSTLVSMSLFTGCLNEEPLIGSVESDASTATPQITPDTTIAQKVYALGFAQDSSSEAVSARGSRAIGDVYSHLEGDSISTWESDPAEDPYNRGSHFYRYGNTIYEVTEGDVIYTFTQYGSDANFTYIADYNRNIYIALNNQTTDESYQSSWMYNKDQNKWVIWRKFNYTLTGGHGPMGEYVNVFQPIDFNALAKSQHGESAIAMRTNPTMYGWAALVNGQQKPLDINRYVSETYGEGHTIAMTGNGAYSWKVLKKDDLKDAVVPVLIVPNNYTLNYLTVGTAKSSAAAKMKFTRDWYKAKTGITFRMTEPICVFDSKYSSDEWVGTKWLESAQNGTTGRYGPYYEAINAYENGTHTPGIKGGTNNTSMFLFPVISTDGDLATEWGAAGSSHYVYTPGEFLYTSVTEERSFFVLGHEGGHAFGLGHTPDGQSSGEYKRVMDYYRGDNFPAASYDLTPEDIATVKQQPAFK